jgi:hypothetical protein
MIRNTDDFVAALRAARRAATPLLAIRTADPASAVTPVQRSLNGATDEAPLVSWDIMAGVTALNQAGKSMLDSIVGEMPPAALGPATVLEAAARLADDAILFYANPQRVWHEATVVQGIWNLRDTLKSVGAMLGPPSKEDQSRAVDALLGLAAFPASCTSL